VKLGALANTNSKEEHFSLKPNTYMNLSGKSAIWMEKKTSRSKTLVITDDLNLSFFGTIIKPRSDGGHNGLKTST
jgi:peptidyl-tRNA hydrolase